jgi:hypothetical protein
MPTKKASKKTKKKSGKKKDEREARKKSGGTKSGGKKAASRKTGGKKTGVKKAGIKKSAATAEGGKKATAKGASRKTGARQAASGKKAATTRAATATRGIAKVQPMTAVAEALIGNCIGFGTAGTFVERAVIDVGGINPADFDIDKKFEEMGVITPNHCALVRQRVLNSVRAFPCTIDDGDVSCDPGDKARVMRDAVQANAGKPQ